MLEILFTALMEFKLNIQVYMFTKPPLCVTLNQITPRGRIRPKISEDIFKIKKKAKAISEVTFIKPNL